MDAVKANHRQTEASADQTQYPLTLRDVSGWMAVPLHAILPTLLSCSLILLGEQGMGKTSLAIIIALAMSRWHIARKKSDEVPSYRLTQDLDFLKNNPGRPEQPVLYDDGDMNEEAPKVMKAFLDMKAPESMTRARYTSVKFHGGQLRIACDNSYNEALGQRLAMSDAAEKTVDDFVQLISPAFSSKFTRAHLMAVLKRATVILNTPTQVVYTIADTESVHIVDIPEHEMYIKPGTPSILERSRCVRRK